MTHSEFVKKVRLLKLIDFKFWCMLIVFGAYALGFIFQIEGKAVELLLYIPMIFLLEAAVNGKNFCCPHCKTPFKLRHAGLIIATGRCYCCNNKLFELPPASAPVFDRMEFIAFHRRKLPWKNIFAAIIITFVITNCGMIIAIPEMVRLHPLILDLFLIWEHLHIELAGVVFLFFALFYAGSRIFSSGGRFAVCPHCRGKLDGILPQIAIASGRCGHCGKTLLFTQSTMPENLFCRESKSERFPAEFHWFFQPWIALIILGFYLAASANGDLLIPLLITAADLMFLAYLALPPRCNHKRIDRIIQRTGCCGICGENLVNNKSLFFFPEGDGIFIPACDRGNSGKLMLTVWLFILLIFIAIGGKVLLDGGGMRALAAPVIPAILLTLYVIGRKKNIPVYGIGLNVDHITLMSREKILIKHSDIISVKKSFYTGNDKKTAVTVYTVKTAQRCYNLKDSAFTDPEQFCQYMDNLAAPEKE
ncbi:MAG: hypothetical protein E7054_01405 [Lentisphaerae bacterium]|nr:hypothetical protein [Lentisphaerota bacterium]